MFTGKKLLTLVLAVLMLLPVLASAQEVKELIGAGASFPYPLYSKWFDVYAKTYGIKVNYQSIGSGGGIRQLMNKTVDFGGSDAFLTSEEKEKFGAEVIHIPATLGGVAIIYNLSTKEQLRLTPAILADIYLGKITTWKDPRIAAENPGVEFPNLPIIAAQRSDGSGTTSIFTDYLCKVSPEWKEKVGMGKSVNWPVGIGGKGNEGVAGSVKQLPGSIGYVEVIYAEKNDLKYALLKNRKGVFISPTIESISTAADIALPDDMCVSITDTEAEKGYPISGFTWILVYRDQKYGNRTIEQARALKDLMLWCVTTAQAHSAELLYAPLPKAATEKALKLVESISFGDDPVKPASMPAVKSPE